MSVSLYGLDWPDECTRIDVELWGYRNDHIVEHGGLGRLGHLREACKILLPERTVDGAPGFIWTPFTERAAAAFCQYREFGNNFETWWGPSSIGKTSNAAMLALIHWLSSPADTTVTVTSTTMPMLEKRIWGEIVRLHSLAQLVGHIPGEHVASAHQIRYDPKNSRAIMQGIAILRGTVAEARGNIVGVHSPHTLVIVDELQATPKAIMQALPNLDTGKEFIFIGIGNPESKLDSLGEYSEPAAGWATLDIGKKEWPTKRGVCLFFDGLDSPGVKDPVRYPFLLRAEHIEATKKNDGEDSPAYWSQRRGFLPPEGIAGHVLTETMITKYNMMGEAKWMKEPEVIVGGDPAFSSGGDRFMLAPAKIGMADTGLMTVQYLSQVQIDLKLSGTEPMLSYLAAKIIAYCTVNDIEPDHLALDCTGMQMMLADNIEREWGKSGIHRIQFGGSPSDLKLDDNDIEGPKRFKNKVSELWFAINYFGRTNQIRGLEVETCKEFCGRMIDRMISPIELEAKSEMKKRTGKSPDRGDAAVVTLDLARLKFGLSVAKMELAVPKKVDDMYRQMDVDSEPFYGESFGDIE